MGKRNTKWSYNTLTRFHSEGRGFGEGADYKPWITTHDFPSKGKVVRILGHKTGRIHHLMSQLEKQFFLILDHTSEVIDIKEQFPLPLSETLIIAAKKGLRHPEIGGLPYVLTTDFFYSDGKGWHAVQIKPSASLKDDRVLEKFEIEKEYYRMIGIDWCVKTEKTISSVMASNYQWLSSGEAVDQLIPAGSLAGITAAFLELYEDITLPFHEIVTEIDAQCELIPGSTMQLFKSLVLNNMIDLDLSRKINTCDPRRSIYA
jgi:hypothetical protein